MEGKSTSLEAGVGPAFSSLCVTIVSHNCASNSKFSKLLSYF